MAVVPGAVASHPDQQGKSLTGRAVGPNFKREGFQFLHLEPAKDVIPYEVKVLLHVFRTGDDVHRTRQQVINIKFGQGFDGLFNLLGTTV